MGALCSSTILAASGHVHVPAPAAVTEMVMQDIESAPTFVDHLQSVKVIRGSGIEAGTRWNEVRVFRGRPVSIYKTITRVERNTKDGAALSIMVSADNKEVSWDNKNAAEVFRVSIIPVDENTCKVLWTMTFVSAGFFGKLSSWLSRRWLPAAIKKHADKEMDCYATEANRRWQTGKAGASGSS